MQIGEAAIGAQIAWLRMLADRGFAHREFPGALAVASGLDSNTDNGAVLDPGSSAGPDVVAWLAAQNVPSSVLLTAPAPHAWTERLPALGMRPENDGHEMGARLDDLRFPASGPSGVHISEVTTGAGLESLFGVFRDADWFDHDECARRVNAAERMGYGSGAEVRHWIARAGDTNVGASTSFLFDSGAEPVVALVHCCVAADYRRRGIGTALTRARTDAARHQGARHALLSPSPEGYELHRTVGFSLAPTPPNRWFYYPNHMLEDGGTSPGVSCSNPFAL